MIVFFLYYLSIFQFKHYSFQFFSEYKNKKKIKPVSFTMDSMNCDLPFAFNFSAALTRTLKCWFPRSLSCNEINYKVQIRFDRRTQYTL